MKAPSTRDERTVVELVRRHQHSVRGFLLFLGCPGDLVDDLVQDVFLSVLSSSFEQRSDAATAAFLRVVARNLYVKAMRRERRRLRVDDWDGLEAAWTEFEGGDFGEGYLTALRECLGGLPERARQVIGLRYGEDLGRVHIAGRLGMSESGVKSVLVRARRRLRECIERRLAS